MPGYAPGIEIGISQVYTWYWYNASITSGHVLVSGRILDTSVNTRFRPISWSIHTHTHIYIHGFNISCHISSFGIHLIFQIPYGSAYGWMEFLTFKGCLVLILTTLFFIHLGQILTIWILCRVSNSYWTSP